MKIKSVECERFAGIKDKEIEFEGGLNILYGKNESGKSSLIDLIYHLFFQNTKLDGRSDKDFVNKYFPKTVGKYQGDVIDGVIRFETEQGTYKLSKEWGMSDSVCKLRTSDGVIIKDVEEINKILGEALCYGKGICDEVVFASQKRPQFLLESILESVQTKKKAENDMKGELASTITKTVMETGGVSIDKMESSLLKILKQYDEHWDFTLRLPTEGKKRGIDNKWNSATTNDEKRSIILRAYYHVEEIKKMMEDAETAEREVERCNSELQSVKKEKSRLEEQREAFREFRSVLEQREQIATLIGNGENELKEQTSALHNWPVAEQNRNEAKRLEDERIKAETIELYNQVKEVQLKLEKKQMEIDQTGSVEPEDVDAVFDLQQKQVSLEGKIAGLNLSAQITKLGDVEVQVKSAMTSEVIDISDDEFTITEAVEINVPGVLEIQLMPQGINLGEIKSELDSTRSRLTEILMKYAVNSIDELKAKQKKTVALFDEKKGLIRDIENKLRGKEWEELKREKEAIISVEGTVSEIAQKILELCGSMSVERFVGAKETEIQQYENKYKTIQELKEKIQGTEKVIETNKNRLKELKDIPEEYQNITNPIEYDESLRNKIEFYEKKVENIQNSLREAEKKLGELSAEEYSEELEKAKYEFEEKEKEYEQWKHIYDEFCKLKESSMDNPTQDIEDKLEEYLKELSAGVLHLDSINEKLDVALISGENKLAYNILSEGTKDTIALAFRLAMLEHLYPNGGGLAIFDDPFTDMDAQRTKQACALIQKYAKNNQVIFVTCDEKYMEMMSGNVISFL